MPTIQETIAAIMSPPKGMLVADEYAEALVEDPVKVLRLAENLAGTPELRAYVSSVLLTRETFDAVGPDLPSSPLFGVRLAPRSDPVRELTELARSSASFVEWRAHLSPKDVPRGAVHIEAATLAQGAAAAQRAGLLPVLTVAMPDLGSASAGVAQAVTSNALSSLREELNRAGVDAQRMLLRVNMVVAGLAHPAQHPPEQVAELTLSVLEKCLPERTAGVLLLSGGQSLETACANLRAVVALATRRAAPWPVTFGFSRPLVSTAARALSGSDEAEAAQLIVHSARLASEALLGNPVKGGTVA